MEQKRNLKFGFQSYTPVIQTPLLREVLRITAHTLCLGNQQRTFPPYHERNRLLRFFIFYRRVDKLAKQGMGPVYTTF